MTFEINDKIKDIEDSDCYYEGIVTGYNEYLVTKIVWCGEQINESPLNEIITFKWWKQEKIN
jgi:hypothetical protein